MTEEQLELLLKARQSLSAAKVLLDNGFPDYATSRTYYTMFYIAEAFLEGEGMCFSSHAAVISAFGREVARIGRVPVEFHQFLIRAQDWRNAGDYGAIAHNWQNENFSPPASASYQELPRAIFKTDTRGLIARNEK